MSNHEVILLLFVLISGSLALFNMLIIAYFLFGLSAIIMIRNKMRKIQLRYIKQWEAEVDEELKNKRSEG